MTTMSSTESNADTEIGVLGRDDLAALKLAESVTFHHLSAEHGGPQIRLHMDRGFGDEPRIYTAAQQRMFPVVDGAAHDRMRRIPVASRAAGYGVDGEGDGWNGDDYPSMSNFYMVHSAQYTDCWPTIPRLLRVGDRLSLVWVADNNTQTVLDAGLHVDQLRLNVHRGTGKPLVFPIATQITRDNSARMIRKQGW